MLEIPMQNLEFVFFFSLKVPVTPLSVSLETPQSLHAAMSTAGPGNCSTERIWLLLFPADNLQKPSAGHICAAHAKSNVQPQRGQNHVPQHAGDTSDAASPFAGDRTIESCNGSSWKGP